MIQYQRLEELFAAIAKDSPNHFFKYISYIENTCFTHIIKERTAE